VPNGGPDGGDGGRGGDVVFVADRNLSTLGDFRDGLLYAAESGGKGGGNQRHGARGAGLMLRVPVGTIIREEGEETVLADLAVDGMSALIARGGRGGNGNKRFATPTRKTPRFAQRGTEGVRLKVVVELKLLADVGLVGLPNAGKSTLLRAWSAAMPKVAAYPFTTLEPELGVVSVGYDRFVAADMPGLIEGASAGVGLGHEFLRHIERTRVLVHVLDMTREEPLADLALINAELAAFGHGLAQKPQLLALNKVDEADAEIRLEELEPELARLGVPWMAISAQQRTGTRELALRAWQLLQEQREHELREAPAPVLRPEPRRARVEAVRDAQGVAVVRGQTAEWLARTFDVSDYEARRELLDRLKRLGVARALQRIGVQSGERVLVGETELEWER
jgi:GTP-binding protein